MKKYISLFILPVALMALTGCDKDTEGFTSVTTYPVIELDGSDRLVINAGTPFVDPGYSATMGTADVTADVVVTTSMNMADPAPGLYSINYSIANPDGISAGVSRLVIVSAPGDQASGFYTVSASSTCNGTAYGNPYSMYIYGYGDGSYFVSDMFGGWYDQRRGYGSAYAMQGDIEIAADGTVTLLDSYIEGWGDGLDSLEDGLFDASTGEISWTLSYAGVMEFIVNAKKN